ncbi:TPA: MFS transporter [Yersinia enterocolitica]
MNLTTSISSSRHPFHYAPFRNLFFARLLTVLGNGIAPIALAFAVLDIGGSATDLGLVVAARSIFNVAFLLIGGVLADRYSRSIVLLSSSTIAALSQGVVAWLVLDGSATIMGLAVLGTINGAAAGIALPASSAMVPQTVPAHSLRAANAFIQVGVYAGTIIGASLGGILTSTIGPGWGLAVDALGFAAAAPLYFFIRVNSTQSLESNTNILQDLRDGWKEFIVLLSMISSTFVLMAGFFIAGVGFGQFGVVWANSLQTHIPADKLARVYAYDAMGSFVAIPVGELAAGPLAMHYGNSTVLLAAAVAVVIATIAASFTPAIRQLDNTSKVKEQHTYI